MCSSDRKIKYSLRPARSIHGNSFFHPEIATRERIRNFLGDYDCDGCVRASKNRRKENHTPSTRPLVDQNNPPPGSEAAAMTSEQRDRIGFLYLKIAQLLQNETITNRSSENREMNVMQFGLHISHEKDMSY